MKAERIKGAVRLHEDVAILKIGQDTVEAWVESAHGGDFIVVRSRMGRIVIRSNTANEIFVTSE